MKASQRKKIRKYFTGLMLCLTFFMGFYYHKQVVRYGFKAYRWYIRQSNPMHYRAGFIDYPEGYSVHGIDVSRWQDNIDWSRARSKTLYGDTLKFQFAFIKATEGIWLEDPMFDDNWKDARKNKIIRGAYHYYNPRADPKLQAKNFMSSVKLIKGDLPPVVDVEETNGRTKKEIVAGLKIYLLAVENKYQVKPIIYSNINFIEDYLADDFSGYKFWVAHFYEEELHVDASIKWLFWQHSDRAGMIGCNYPVDVNVFNGSRNDLLKILVK